MLLLYVCLRSVCRSTNALPFRNICGMPPLQLSLHSPRKKSTLCQPGQRSQTLERTHHGQHCVAGASRVSLLWASKPPVWWGHVSTNPGFAAARISRWVLPSNRSSYPAFLSRHQVPLRKLQCTPNLQNSLRARYLPPPTRARYVHGRSSLRIYGHLFKPRSFQT